MFFCEKNIKRYALALNLRRKKWQVLIYSVYENIKMFNEKQEWFLNTFIMVWLASKESPVNYNGVTSHWAMLPKIEKLKEVNFDKKHDK